MIPKQQTEIERKYDVAADCVVPDLSGLPGVASVSDPVELEQVATYFDTPQLGLLAAKVTLRRRVGGVDDGWHLKLPGTGDRREELQLPLGEETAQVPAAFLERVRVRARSVRLAPVAVLTTHRTLRRLLDEGGRVLAELCDDRVTAEAPVGEPASGRWREWELELVGGTPELLDAAESLLLVAGAEPSANASKVARALAEQMPVQLRPTRTSLGRRPTTGAVFTAYLAQHRDRLMEQELLLKTGDQEGVHQVRVAVRRMRSALATYRPVLDRGAVDALTEELRWLGGALSEARDAQVLQVRLDALVQAQPSDLVLGPVAQRIDDELRERFLAGRRRAEEALAGERYVRLLGDLERFASEPPVNETAALPARKLVPELIEADLARVLKRHRVWKDTEEPVRKEHHLHQVRKAAKRLRYAAETAQPVFGKRALRLAARAEALQELLGEHQDTVVARAVLLEIGVGACRSGESGVTFGRLHALEEARAAQIVREYPPALARLPRGELREWLRR